MFISGSQHIYSLLILGLWQVISAAEVAEWISERTAHHALQESREALRVAWKRFMAFGSVASEAQQPAAVGTRWNDAAPDPVEDQ